MPFCKLALATGDPNGIGPEIALKALATLAPQDRDRITLFGPRAVLGVVEEAEDLGPGRDEIDRLATQAIAADDDCVPDDPVKPVAKPKPKALPRSAMTELARPKTRSFSEQVDAEKKRFQAPAKIKVRALAGRQC